MKFFIDNCVPNSVGHMLRTAGHEVIFLREVIAPNCPDPIVAAISEAQGAILVSLDSDFRSIAPRVGDGNKKRFRKLSRIGLRCSEPQAAARLRTALSLIEHEWDVALRSTDKRMILDVGSSWIRTVR